SFTDRAFTRIDEAFRFVGAAPLELADEVNKTGVLQFTKNPARTRKIDYVRDQLDFFVGDPSPGSGYSAEPEGQPAHAPTTGLDAVSGAATSAAAAPSQMSGVFP